MYRDDLDTIFTKSNTQASMTDVLRRFALSGDGMVDKSAFISAVRRMGVHADEKWHNLFQMFDPKKHGKADVEIVAAALAFWHRTFGAAPASADLAIARMDSDVSMGAGRFGSMGGIWQQLAQKRREFEDALLRMDVGLTGRISRQELTLALQHIGILLAAQGDEIDHLLTSSGACAPKDTTGIDTTILYRHLLQRLAQIATAAAPHSIPPAQTAHTRVGYGDSGAHSAYGTAGR